MKSTADDGWISGQPAEDESGRFIDATRGTAADGLLVTANRN